MADRKAGAAWEDHGAPRKDFWAPPDGLPATHEDGMGGTKVKAGCTVSERAHGSLERSLAGCELP